jgi:hypothetical protein
MTHDQLTAKVPDNWAVTLQAHGNSWRAHRLRELLRASRKICARG